MSFEGNVSKDGHSSTGLLVVAEEEVQINAVKSASLPTCGVVGLAARGILLEQLGGGAPKDAAERKKKTSSVYGAGRKI